MAGPSVGRQRSSQSGLRGPLTIDKRLPAQVIWRYAQIEDEWTVLVERVG